MPQASDAPEPKISVIIPVYNTEKYLRQCLNSVLHQTFPNWEALLCDDCSTDNSLQILREYAQKDPRFKVFQNSTNIGPGPTRNNALKAASGTWIMFLDADDFWMPDLLLKITRTACGLLQDIICFPFIRVTTTGATAYEFPPLFTREGVHPWEEKFLAQSQLATDKAFRRTFLQKWNIHFADGKRYCEDILFSFCALTCAKTYYYLPFAGYCYRQTPKSCTENLDKLLLDCLRVQKTLKRELKRLDVFNEKLYLLLCCFHLSPHIRKKAVLSPAYTLYYQLTRRQMQKLRCTTEDFKDNLFCSYKKYLQIRSSSFCRFHWHRKNIPTLLKLFAAHMKRSVQNLLK